ncbi:MAG TPA: tetratricopeptide repeat protein [Stenotrophomonas sp.]|jgi:TolB-like protein/DNA-binding winged helix-turn-helix (wHTH) protein/Flp pilus assembly protein TadD
MDPKGDPDSPVHPAERYRFEGVVVDASAHTLLRDGVPQSVEPKAFAVLLVLLRHAGDLVTRDHLLDAIWGHRHVTPGVLTRAIAQLRAALDERPQSPRFIQTQHALGYRFIGALQPDAATRGLPGMIAVPEPAAGQAPELQLEPSLPLARVSGFAQVLRRESPDNGSAGSPAPSAQPAAPSAAVPQARWPSTALPFGRGGGRGSTRRRGWALAGSALLLILIVGLGWSLRQAPSPAPPPGMASVAVRPFSNPDGSQDDRYFADGLSAEVRDALAGVPGLKVAAQAAGGSPEPARYDASRWGKTIGVASVLDASVQRIGDQLRVRARLTDTDSGATLWSGSYDRAVEQVFSVQNEIAAEVVHQLMGRVPGVDRQLERRLTPTRDPGAYEDYLRGLAELQRPRGEGSYERALDAFHRALARDPQFARAQAGICRAEIVRLESVSEAVAYERARQACAQAKRMDPGMIEGTLAMADIARASGDYRRALALYEQALSTPALRADAYVGMARSHGALEENALALDDFRKALALRPGDAQIYKAMGYHHWLRGELGKAIEAYLSATLLQPEDSGLWSSLGGLYLAKGDVAQAGRAFNMSLSIEPNAGALTNLGAMRFDAGDYAQAADMFQRAATLQPDDYLHWGNLADALAASPSTAARAADSYRRAADLAQAYVGIKDDDAYALAALAWYRANLGQSRQALEALKAAQASGEQAGEVALWCAQVLYLLGDDHGGEQCVANAQSHGIPAQRIEALLKARGFTATALPGGVAGAQILSFRGGGSHRRSQQ